MNPISYADKHGNVNFSQTFMQVAGYTQILGLASGIAKIAYGVFQVLSGISASNQDQIKEGIIFIGRGLIESMGLGCMFIPLDIYATLINKRQAIC